MRIIAPPHMEFACGSAWGKGFGNVHAMCVRAAHFERGMFDHIFALFFQLNDNISCYRMSFPV